MSAGRHHDFDECPIIGHAMFAKGNLNKQTQPESLHNKHGKTNKSVSVRLREGRRKPHKTMNFNN